jgi:hypothetical protein
MPRVHLFESRSYRDFESRGSLIAFRARVETSDLYIRALKPLEKEATSLIRQAREQIEAAIKRRPDFLESLTPMDELDQDSTLVNRMIAAGKKAGTGPMSAVAGAVAEYVGRGLLPESEELMVENGGDIFIKVSFESVVGIFASDSPFSGKIGVLARPDGLPISICASSATVGPSLSKGNADASVIISRDAPLADAMATAMGNRIKNEDDLQGAVNWALSIQGVKAAVAIKGDRIAAKGDLELIPLDR